MADNDIAPMNVDIIYNEDDSLENTLSNLSLQERTLQTIRMKSDGSNAVKRICGEEITNGIRKFYVEFFVGDKMWLPEENLSKTTIKNYNIITKHNKTIIAPNSSTAFIYTRTSNKNDCSQDTQLTSILNYCILKGFKCEFIGQDDGVSGRYNERSGIMNNLNYELGFMMPHLTKNNVLMVYSIDRLGRNASSVLTILDELAKKGVDIHFVKEGIVWNSQTPSYIKLMVQQQTLQAQQLSDLTSEKIKYTQERLRRVGHVFGRASFGYKMKRTKLGKIRKRVKNPLEQHLISKIKSYIEDFKTELIVVDGRSRFMKYNEILKKVSRKLKDEGLKYRNKDFNAKNITYILNMGEKEHVPDDDTLEEIPKNGTFNINTFVNTPHPSSNSSSNSLYNDNLSSTIQLHNQTMEETVETPNTNSSFGFGFSSLFNRLW